MSINMDNDFNVEEGNLLLHLLEEEPSHLTLDQERDLDLPEPCSPEPFMFDYDYDTSSISPTLAPLSLPKSDLVRGMMLDSMDDSTKDQNSDPNKAAANNNDETINDEKVRDNIEEKDQDDLSGRKRALEEDTASPCHGKCMESLESYIAFHFMISRNLDVDENGKFLWEKFSESAPPSLKCTQHKEAVMMLLGQMRSNSHSSFWDRVLETIESEASDADALFAIGELLLDSFGRSSSVLFEGDFVMSFAQALVQQAKKFGQVLPLSRWPATARQQVIKQLLFLHQDESLSYGNKFHRIHYHFKDILSLAEVEMAILQHCTCDNCKHEWNLDNVDRSDDIRFYLHYMREKAETQQSLLVLHKSCGGGADRLASLMTLNSGHLCKFASWTASDISTMLRASHSQTRCSVCERENARTKQTKRRKRSAFAFADNFAHLDVDGREKLL